MPLVCFKMLAYDTFVKKYFLLFEMLESFLLLLKVKLATVCVSISVSSLFLSISLNFVTVQFFTLDCPKFVSTSPSRSTSLRFWMPLSTTSRIFDISNWFLDILQVTFDDDVSSSFTRASSWLPSVCISDLRLTLSVKLTNLKRLSTLLRLSLSYLNELLSNFLHILILSSWRLLTIFTSFHSTISFYF